MKITQTNPAQEIMDVRQVSLGTATAGGMVSRLSLDLKGKVDGKIKNWQLEFESFAELDDVIEQLQQLKPFAAEHTNFSRALRRQKLLEE